VWSLKYSSEAAMLAMKFSCVPPFWIFWSRSRPRSGPQCAPRTAGRWRARTGFRALSWRRSLGPHQSASHLAPVDWSNKFRQPNSASVRKLPMSPGELPTRLFVADMTPVTPSVPLARVTAAFHGPCRGTD
jgi:hypothetical protein